MSKKIFTKLLTSICLMGPISTTIQITPQVVQAASNKVQVKGSKKIRLYNSKGKKTKYYAYSGKRYAYSTKKKLKISKKTYLAYKLNANSYWLLAKNAKVVKNTTLTVPTSYSQATIKLPSGYTLSGLLEAYKGAPSESFIDASMKGMEINNFSRVAKGESSRDKRVINPSKLTASDQKELTEFALKIINSAREQLGLHPWIYSSGTQQLANDIAKEYQDNGRSISDGDHYISGIVRACKKNGLDLDNNYVEDMAGFSIKKTTMPMGEMKKDIYFGLKQMIFGFTGAGESTRNNKSLYREWEHAGDLFNTQDSVHDGDYNYYGFSISKTGNTYSMHFISVPNFVVESSKYNVGFKP